jgi:hypothetical protein
MAISQKLYYVHNKCGEGIDTNGAIKNPGLKNNRKMMLYLRCK